MSAGLPQFNGNEYDPEKMRRLVDDLERLFLELSGQIAQLQGGTAISVFAGAGTTGVVPDPVVENGLVLGDSGEWVAQFKLADIPVFGGAGGNGLVPDPGTENGHVLSDDGSWIEVPFPPVFEGAGADGLVPDPGALAGFFLRDDGTWADPTAGGSSLYRGYVGANGSAGNRLPAGWSATRNAIGTYTITHNLGLADLSRLAFVFTVVHTGFASNSGFPRLAQINSEASNGNAVQVIITTDFAGIDRADNAFFFIASPT